MRKKKIEVLLEELADTGYFTQEAVNEVKKRMVYYGKNVLAYPEVQDECEVLYEELYKEEEMEEAIEKWNKTRNNRFDNFKW